MSDETLLGDEVTISHDASGARLLVTIRRMLRCITQESRDIFVSLKFPVHYSYVRAFASVKDKKAHG